MTHPLKPLMPGTTLDLGHYRATVYPAGAKHANALFTKVMPIVDAMASMLLRRAGETKQEHALRVSVDLVPMALENAYDIIADCVVLPDGAKLDDVPHWDLPTITQAWIFESFGEEKKRRPWIALVEKLLTRLNGGKPISMSEIFSKASSLMATVSATSTKPSSQESPIAE